MKVWEYIFWDAFSLAIGYWCVHWCLEPRPASPLEGYVELSQLRHQPRGGNSPWVGWLSLFATLVTAGGTKGQLTKSYNISQVFNPGVTTSKTAHFSEQVRDVPVTAGPLWTLLSACCSARSVLYWKLKWQTGWGRRVFRSSYLVKVSASNQAHVPAILSPGSKPAAPGVLCRAAKSWWHRQVSTWGITDSWDILSGKGPPQCMPHASLRAKTGLLV